MTPDPTTRRRFLTVTGGGTIVGLAGCTSDSSDPENSSENATQTELEDENEEADNETNSSDSDSDEPDADKSADELTLQTDFLSREEYAQPGESFDDFEDLSAWNVVSGSVDTDSDVVFDGSQSVKLSAEGSKNITIERNLEDEDVDLTDLDFSFALRTTTPGNIAVYLRFVDVYGSDRFYQLRQLSYRTPDVGWFRSNPGVFEDSEVPTEMDMLERVELTVLNTGPEAEVWVDDLRTHEKPDKGYVVLCWDDGRQAFYDTASPLHDEYGFNAVQGPIPGNVRGRYMSVEMLKERQEAGDEIVMHGTHDPIHEIEDEQELEGRLRRDKQWFIDNDLQGANHIIYPHNSFDKTALEYINKYHYSGGFNQSGDVNTTGVYGYDPLVLPRTIAHDLDISKRCVDMAAAHNNCTILNFHAFEEDNTMSEADYEELLAHIDGKDDLEVITLSELWEMRMSGH